MAPTLLTVGPNGEPVLQYATGEMVPLQAPGGMYGTGNQGAGGPAEQGQAWGGEEAPLLYGTDGGARPAGGGGTQETVPGLVGTGGVGYDTGLLPVSQPLRPGQQTAGDYGGLDPGGGYGGDAGLAPVRPPSSRAYPVYRSSALGQAGFKLNDVTGGGGGGGGTPSLASGKARLQGALASAQGRIQGALGGGGSSSGASSSGYGGTSYGGTPDYQKLKHGWAKGMDPTQAAGFMLRPSGMIPRVFPGASPADPTYTELASMPAAQMAMLMGGKGGTQRLTNNLGNLYSRAGSQGWLPSTGRMLGNLQSGKGVNALFQGEKAGKGDYPSSTVPGYEYGKEPLLLGEATETYGGLLDAALYGENELVQAKYGGTLPGQWVSYLMDKWASKAAKRKPGRGPEINQYVTKRLFRSG
jgi:hypothetical protein